MKLRAPNGYSIHYYDQIDSTNAECHRLASGGARLPLWVVAAQQSAGRGRHGRHWVSEPGNLFASLLIKPECPVERVAELSFVAALALFRTLARLGCREEQLTLKWPNDVLLVGRKCAGILLEAQSAAARLDWTVVGMGVNLAHAPEVAMNQTIALVDVLGPSLGIAELFGDLASGIAVELAAWQTDGFDKVRKDWEAHSVPLGTMLAVKSNGSVPYGQVEGRFSGLDQYGGLILEDKQGKLFTVYTGDLVKHEMVEADAG